MLEQKIEGKWYAVPVVVEGDYGFNEIGFMISEDGTLEMDVDFEWLYGSLSNGTYRIIKSLYLNKEGYRYFGAEFTITSKADNPIGVNKDDYTSMQER